MFMLTMVKQGDTWSAWSKKVGVSHKLELNTLTFYADKLFDN